LSFAAALALAAALSYSGCALVGAAAGPRREEFRRFVVRRAAQFLGRTAVVLAVIGAAVAWDREAAAAATVGALAGWGAAAARAYGAERRNAAEPRGNGGTTG